MAFRKAFNRRRILAWLLSSPLFGRAALVLAGLALLFAVFSLAAAAGNTQAWAENYNIFLGINIGLSLALALLVASLLVRLLWRLKQEKFGARLTLKFAGAFASLALLPGVLVYLVSILFLHQSIEGWFNVRVDTALNAGIELSRAAMDGLLQDLTLRTRNAALNLEWDNPTNPVPAQIERIQANTPNSTVLLLDSNARVLASAGIAPHKQLNYDTPNANALQVLKRTGVYSQLESTPNAGTLPAGDTEVERLSLRAVVNVVRKQGVEPNTLTAPSLNLNLNTPLASPVPPNQNQNQNQNYEIPLKIIGGSSALYLQISTPVPVKLAQWAQAVTQGLRDYETLALGRAGLRKIYATTLTLTTLLSVLAAIAAGFVLADAMSAPLLRLARGTEAVAAGDFTPLPAANGNDDLAVLTRSFNRMSFDLDAARSALTRSNAFLEQVLGGLTTGVIVLGPDRDLRNANPAAIDLLSDNATEISTEFVLPAAFFDAVTAQLDAQPSAPSATIHGWQAQPEMNLHVGKSKQTFLLSGSPILLDDGVGTLLVFDDISKVLVAQRAQAWAEVAQRLAHEIKNPLTPIQLSAERLAIKLADKVQGNDAELLKRATGTIVSQVGALKTLVDEFRNYARLPQAKLKAQSLHTALNDVLSLYTSAKIAGQHIDLTLEAHQDHVMLDANQIRQVLHNLVANGLDSAIEAQEKNASDTGATVHVSTRDHAHGICLRVADNGVGFSATALAKLFEPYHTTKAKGTGLGLAIVQRIVLDHGATIQVKNLARGAAVDIIFPRVSPLT